MSAPSLESSISTSSEEIRANDLPETMIPQSLIESKTTDVAVVIDTDKGNLGVPVLGSEGNELGELTPDSENDETLESRLSSESNALEPPTLDVISAPFADGLSHADDMAGMAPRPRFLPRGKLDKPSLIKKFDGPNDPRDPKNQRKNVKEEQKQPVNGSKEGQSKSADGKEVKKRT